MDFCQKEEKEILLDKTKETRDRLFKNVIDSLTQKGIYKDGSIKADYVDLTRFTDQGKKEYSSADIGNKFDEWLKVAEVAKNKKIKDQDLINFFLKAHFPAYRESNYSDYKCRYLGWSFGTKVSTLGTVDTTIGLGNESYNVFAPQSKSRIGMQYSKDGLGPSVELSGVSAKISKKGTNLGIGGGGPLNVSLSKPKHGLWNTVIGFSLGPFGWGYNFLTKKISRSMDWFGTVLGVLTLSWSKANERSKEKGTNLAIELSKQLVFPQNIWNTAFEVFVKNPIAKLIDIYDGLFPTKVKEFKSRTEETDPKKIADIVKEENKKISMDIGRGNFNTAKKRIRNLLSSPISSKIATPDYAKLKDQEDKIEFSIAYSGLPISLNIFNPSTFLRSKKKLAERNINDKITNAITNVETTIDALSKEQNNMNLSQELAQNLDLDRSCEYLKTKLPQTENGQIKLTPEGYAIPNTPVPRRDLNEIVEAIGKVETYRKNNTKSIGIQNSSTFIDNKTKDKDKFIEEQGREQVQEEKQKKAPVIKPKLCNIVNNLSKALETKKFKDCGWRIIEDKLRNYEFSKDDEKQHFLNQINLMIKLWGEGQIGKNVVASIITKCIDEKDSLQNVGNDEYVKGTEIFDRSGKKKIGEVRDTSPVLLWLKEYRTKNIGMIPIENKEMIEMKKKKEITRNVRPIKIKEIKISKKENEGIPIRKITGEADEIGNMKNPFVGTLKKIEFGDEAKQTAMSILTKYNLEISKNTNQQEMENLWNEYKDYIQKLDESDKKATDNFSGTDIAENITSYSQAYKVFHLPFFVSYIVWKKEDKEDKKGEPTLEELNDLYKKYTPPTK
ncbi:MAG: hypothetical protein AB1391_01020 [Candidatus Micrarchaeota archaeon]